MQKPSGQGTVYIGADHAGFSLKQQLIQHLNEKFPDLTIEDCGTNGEASVDYPDFAKTVADKVAKHGRGILVCGSGIGMCITANKVAGVRAAQVWDATSARLSREHNDANVMCIGARLMGTEVAFEAARVWLSTAFGGGRHQKRIDKILQLEEK